MLDRHWSFFVIKLDMFSYNYLGEKDEKSFAFINVVGSFWGKCF